MDQHICYYDFNKKKWNIGDLIGEAENLPILQNSSVIQIEKGNIMKKQVIVTGGYESGYAVNTACILNLSHNK